MTQKKKVRFIHEEKDILKLQGMVIDLWSLLDQIDTLDDICKDNSGMFRVLARDTQKERHKILTSDGYNLFIPTKEIVE